MKRNRNSRTHCLAPGNTYIAPFEDNHSSFKLDIYYYLFTARLYLTASLLLRFQHVGFVVLAGPPLTPPSQWARQRNCVTN
jgi:hypothetical protein